MQRQTVSVFRRFLVVAVTVLGIVPQVATIPHAAGAPPNRAAIGYTRPELMYYRFDEAGTQVRNEASRPVGTTPAPIMGGLSIGGSGQFDTGLRGNNELGTTGYLNTGWAPNLGAGNWTISLWTSAVPASTTLFYFFGDVNTGSLRAFTNGVAGANNLILRGAGMADVTILNGASTAQPSIVHFVYDSALGNIKGYLNGTLVTTVAQSGPNWTGTGPFKVGGYASNTGLATGQVLDEFRLYNRALSADEVAATWNRSLMPELAITKSTATPSVRPGDTIQYTIAYSNTSVVLATNVRITDTLALDIQNPTVEQSGAPLIPIPGEQYVWTVPELGMNEGGVITITGTLATPRSAGILTNSVTITADAATATATIPVTVQNVAPQSNAGLDQTADNDQTVTLDGRASLDVNGDTLTYQWQQTAGPAVTLSDVNAATPTFLAPATTSALVFSLTVTDSNGLQSPIEDQVTVQVTRREANYDSTPAAGQIIALGNVTTGGTVTTTLTVRETGNTTLTITGTAISGTHAADFSVAPSSFSIADGGTPQALTISCTPGAAGVRTATLQINHNAPGSPATYPLTCTATDLSAGYGSTPAAGSGIIIGRAAIGSSITTTLTIRELGSSILNVTELRFTGTHATDFQITPTSFSLADGAPAQVVQIQCRPGAIGVRTATLRITHNASGGFAEYAVTCTGVDRTFIPAVRK